MLASFGRASFKAFFVCGQSHCTWESLFGRRFGIDELQIFFNDVIVLWQVFSVPSALDSFKSGKIGPEYILHFYPRENFYPLKIFSADKMRHHFGLARGAK